MTGLRSTWNTSCLVRPKPGNNPARFGKFVVPPSGGSEQLSKTAA